VLQCVPAVSGYGGGRRGGPLPAAFTLYSCDKCTTVQAYVGSGAVRTGCSRAWWWWNGGGALPVAAGRRIRGSALWAPQRSGLRDACDAGDHGGHHHRLPGSDSLSVTLAMKNEKEKSIFRLQLHL